MTSELSRRADRSWWLEEALAHPEFAGPDAPPLRRDTTVDVVIVGGGYTGMWSAWFLKQAQPDLDVPPAPAPRLQPRTMRAPEDPPGSGRLALALRALRQDACIGNVS